MTDTPLLLQQVLEKTFEDFAFMFIDPAPARQVLKADEETYVQASIHFTTHGEEGQLTALASMRFCRFLSHNILGLDPEDPLESGTAESALSEVVNVACGLLAENLYGVDQVVDLLPPESVLCSGKTWEEEMASNPTLVLFVDDYPVCFQLGLWQLPPA